MVSGVIVKEGILVGRPAQGKHVFNWAVIPPFASIDVLETSLPTPLFSETLIVNSRRSRQLLRKLYVVEYVRRDSLSFQRSFISFADITNIKKKIPVEEIEEHIKEVDDETRIISFKEEPEINEQFMVDLTSTLGTGAELSRRFYSTQVIFTIKNEENKYSILIPLKETLLFLQENPAIMKGIILLPKYHFGIITTKDDINEEIFKEVILDQVQLSAKLFDNLLSRSSMSTQED